MIRRELRSIGSGVLAFRRLDWADRRLFCEALAALCVVSAGIRCVPFRHLIRLAAWPIGKGPARRDEAVLIRRVRWSILAASARLPWRAVCLHQSLVAQILLRRRGVSATLFYGARLKADRELEAHTWVRVGAVGVVGVENAGDFALITRVPSAD